MASRDIMRSTARNFKKYYSPDIKGELRLDTNTNALGANPAAERFLNEQRIDINEYPNTYSDGLRSALAELYGLDMENFVAGTGSDEMLDVLFKTFTDWGDDCGQEHLCGWFGSESLAHLRFEFEGTGLDLWGWGGNNPYFQIWIDGEDLGGQGLPQGHPSSLPGQRVFSKRDLAPGVHVVHITYGDSFYLSQMMVFNQEPPIPDVYEGDKSVKLTWDKAATYNMVFWQQVTVEPQSEYEISFWAKGGAPFVVKAHYGDPYDNLTGTQILSRSSAPVPFPMSLSKKKP